MPEKTDTQAPKHLRLAQISDMHCYKLTVNPTQFLSKRWLGNINVLVNRRLEFEKDPDLGLIGLFKEQNVDHVIISGDMTTTSLPEEFEKARAFVDQIEQTGMKCHLVPGNHDHYTRLADKQQIFHKYFDPSSSGDVPNFNMSTDKVAIRPLAPGWWTVLLDTTFANVLMTSQGKFTEHIEASLEKALRAIPETDRIVLVNHFAMFATIHPSHDLRRADALRALLMRWPNVKLYMHGHVHKQSISDQRASGLPIILNSGSCGLKRKATCHIIDITSDTCTIEVYGHDAAQNGDSNPWTLRHSESFEWSIP